MTASTLHRFRAWTTLAASALIATSALTLSPSIAHADQVPVEEGSLSWGIRESWRGYVGVGGGQPGPGATGKVVGEDGAIADSNGIATWTLNDGDVDFAAGTGSASFTGTMLLLGHPGSFYPYEYPVGSGDKWGMWQRWSDPELTFTSPTTASLAFSVSSFSASAAFPTIDPPIKTSAVELTFAPGDLADGIVTTTSAILTESGAQTVWNSYGTYQPGIEMDPISFDLRVEQPAATATETSVAATPDSVTVGDTVTFSATVNPKAAGTIQFSDNGTSIGDPVEVDTTTGKATWETTSLPAGTHDITAAFTPADPAAFAPSTAASPATITVVADDLSTHTALAVSPDSPSAAGSDITLTATVSDESSRGQAQGSVQFFTTPDGGSKTPLGAAVTVDPSGKAVLTTSELAPGGHVFLAEFTSSNGYDSSVSDASKSYGIVDIAQPALCTPTNAETLNGVTARWDWSAYSNGADHTGGGGFAWNKAADGNIDVSTTDTAATFVLSDGTASVSDNCTTVAFEGTMRVEAYNGFFAPHGQWVELVDPTLVLTGDGKGAWVAGVRTGTGELNTDTSEPVTIVEVDGASNIDFSADSVNGDVSFAFDDTTARGTWSPGRTGAWSNGFVITVPSMIRSFYYASGAGGDVNKPAAPLSIAWTFDATQSATADGKNEGAAVEVGKPLVLQATGFRAGERVEVRALPSPSDGELAKTTADDSVPLGEATADTSGTVSLTWVPSPDFALGSYTATFASVSSDRQTSVTFQVLPASDNNQTPPGGDDDGGKDNTTPGGNQGTTIPAGKDDPNAAASPKAHDKAQGQLSKTGADGVAAAVGAALLLLLGGAGSVLLRRRLTTTK